jgi:hypothetical protein
MKRIEDIATCLRMKMEMFIVNNKYLFYAQMLSAHTIRGKENTPRGQKRKVSPAKMGPIIPRKE